MLTIETPEVETPSLDAAPEAAEITLANGRRRSLAGLDARQLYELQWEQEQAFAQAIRESRPRSPERRRITAVAYDTICTILSVSRGDAAGELSMGMDSRYAKLVLQLLTSQDQRGVDHPTLFELGYGSGVLLQEVRAHGFEAAGVEVSLAMRENALARLGQERAASLLLGDVRDVTVDSLPSRPTVIYSNDVLEHLPVDEVAQYVEHLYGFLPRRGLLVTITPNWLLRPSDVTGDFCPPRTEPRGLHLKEYQLSEVASLLKRAGFRKIATPLFATRGRLWLAGNGGRQLKQLIEPHLDRIPLRLAHLACRGLAMSCTIAVK
ncbi:methyltransferase domain-containing protein [Pirellulales bacterium]|nr:methyltransferase domain-containing protein [Pirellulales bacterium]